jgi:flavin-dependent dehydrogenase
MSTQHSSHDHDVVIVGGGPAGATCARFAVRQRLDVAVIERTGTRTPKHTSAGIFDHTWSALALDPGDYPHAMHTPHAFEFTTLKDRKRLPDVLKFVAPRLKRHAYFPNRDEFDVWLLGLAQKEGAQVLQDSVVRPGDIEHGDGRYHIRVGGESHTARILVGAAGTRCPVYRRYFESAAGWPGKTMLLTEVEAPASEYSGPQWASYFGFADPSVFAWSYVVGDDKIHIGTAAISTGRSTRRDMRFDEFLDFLKTEDYVGPDFEPKDHYTSGGSIRMFANTPMSSVDGTCHVIGDAAGLLQRDAYNGITNAIMSGRLCADAIARGDRDPKLRKKLNPYLFQDVLRDMLSGPLPFLRQFE